MVLALAAAGQSHGTGQLDALETSGFEHLVHALDGGDIVALAEDANHFDQDGFIRVVEAGDDGRIGFGQAELAQGPEAAMNADPLADVAPSGNGTDADAGEYLND